MSTSSPLTHLLEMLHRAFRSQMFHAPDHPQAVRNMEALATMVESILGDRGSFTLSLDQQGFSCQGRTVEGAPHAALSLAKEMQARGLDGLSFKPGVDLDELNLFLFVLQLRPQRLVEMGGPFSLLPEDGCLVPVLAPVPEPVPMPEPEAMALPCLDNWPEQVPAPEPAQVPNLDHWPEQVPTPEQIPTPAPVAEPLPEPGFALELELDLEPEVHRPLQQPAALAAPAAEPEPPPAPETASASGKPLVPIRMRAMFQMDTPPVEVDWGHVFSDPAGIPDPADAFIVADPDTAPELLLDPLPAAPPAAMAEPVLPVEPIPMVLADPVLITMPEPAPALLPEPLAKPEPLWEPVRAIQPEPAPLQPPTPAALAEELRPLFLDAISRTSPVLRAGPHSPWDADHRDALKRFGFAVPDFTAMAGFGARMGLDAMPPTSLRDALRKALSSLESFDQGNVLLGLPGFPAGEHALRRALDFLAPELLAQAVAHAHVRHQPSRFDLALLTVALMQCVHDRELSLEAIRGRLQFEGWGIQEVEELKEAVQWECQGTDTKLNLSLEHHGIHAQDPHLVMTLGRQLIRARRMDDLRSLLSQLEEELASPTENRRRHGAEILGDLAVSLQESGLSQDLERRILLAAHERLCADNDEMVAQWCAQAVEAMLGRWILVNHFHGVHSEMVSLGELAYTPDLTRSWKGQLVRDLLARVASPSNIALLLPTLYQDDGDFSRTELYAILALMGTPAASCLAGWLEFEEDPARRSRLAEALEALGKRAVPVLKECLASPHGFMVEHALQLLAKAGDRSVLPDLLLALSHWDANVRRAAVLAVAELAGKTAAAQALADALATANTAARLEYLIFLGDLGDPVAIPAVIQLLQPGPNPTEETQRIRLRAVETMGLIPSPDSVRPLLELFQKKGLFKGRESLGLRLCAARALAAINTREARESMALALESEPQEEVRAVLKQYLVRR